MPPPITPPMSPVSTGGGGFDSMLGALPMVGGVLNGVTQMFTNAANKKFQVSMYNRQRQDALSDWNMQNVYNSPSSQMARLKSAGLNPNLVYGNGANAMEAAPVRQSSPGGSNQQAPNFNFGGAMPLLMFQLKEQMQQAQIQHLSDQNALLISQIGKTGAETQKTQAITDDLIPAQIRNLNSSTGLRELELDIKSALEETTIAQGQANLSRTLIDNNVLNMANDPAQALNLTSIAEKTANILRTYAETKLTGARQDLVNAEAAAVLKSNTLKDTEIDARKHGYTWSDDQAERVAAQLLGKYGGAVPGVLKALPFMIP